MGQYHYEKYNSQFEVYETKTQYVVECLHTGNISSSRLLNALENRLRMQSLDLMGAYELYKDFAKRKNLKEDYFQLFANYTSFDYDASVDMLTASNFVTSEKGREVTFKVEKKNFVVDVTKYPLDDIDIKQLLNKHYKKRRNPERALDLYYYQDFSAADYLNIYKDFLMGRGKIMPAFNLLTDEKFDNRFELSILEIPDTLQQQMIDSVAADALSQRGIIKQIMYAELVTSAKLEDKQAYYEAFTASLNPGNNIWEDMIAFVSENRDPSYNIMDDPTMFSIIGAMPGAINPFALRLSNERTLYDKGEALFSKEKINKALEALEQSINYEGFHVRTLNLIGATYRFDGQPEKAMPYLILAYLMDPEARFVAGNMAICLKALNYKSIDDFVTFLTNNANIDPWSKEQIDNL